MQLLDSQQSQLSDVPAALQRSLQAIANQVQIESYHRIKHPNYKTIELPESVVPRFEQLPVEIQKNHLSLQLRNFIYGVYYNGSLKSDLASDNVVTDQNHENNSLFGVDLAFYERLNRSNKGAGYWSHDWLVIKEETDGTLALHKNGLTLHIERNIYLPPESQAVTVGNLVAIKMPKNLVQNSFYMAIANLSSPQNPRNLARVYFNLTPDGAVAVMESLTTKLNAIPISFSFKALYNPSDYGRYDSAVLYFDKNNYEKVRPILERVYVENQTHFHEQVPLFTKFLAPGLACAEEPDHKFAEQESFGTHRSQIIANGLLDAWEQGDNTADGRMASILQNFSLRQIKLQSPYLNPNSEDVYTSLNL